MINDGGTVSPVSGSPFDEGLGQTSVIQVTADPQGRFVYVLNVGASAVGQIIGQPGIGAFAVDRTTGALRRAPPIVFPARNDNNIAVDGSGHFLFEPNLALSGFDVYAIDQSSGALTKTSANSNAPPVGSFTVTSSDGRFLFNGGNGTVEVFSIDPQGGLIAIGTPISTTGSGGPIAVSQDGRFLYAANKNEGTLMVFDVSPEGTLTGATGAPFEVDIGAQFLALTPDGRFLYIASFNSAAAVSANVKGYSVNPTAGAFSPIPGAVINNASSVTIDLSGQRAYISVSSPQSFGLTLSTFSIDQGALTPTAAQARSPTSDDPFNMVTTP
jgi:6-phosphogluconolactonase (cycloisomerase 2 family)